MPQLCRWALAHWVRYDGKRAAEHLDLSRRPAGCAAWTIGPDVPASTAAARSGSQVWCAVAAFRDEEAAQAAFQQPERYLPDLSQASEAWHALLIPFAHKGECNHLDLAAPGLLFEPQPDPGGPLFVTTTAGFELRSRSDFQRLIDFRRGVEAMRETVAAADGSLAHQVFVAQDSYDGVTMSLWSDEKSMFSFAYKPGPHRVQVDRQNSEQTVDRSSFTRFRVVASAGHWGGVDPLSGATRR